MGTDQSGAVEFTGAPDPQWLGLLAGGRQGGEAGADAVCGAYSKGIAVGLGRAQEAAAGVEPPVSTGEGEFEHLPTRVRAVRWWVNGDHPDDRVGEQAPDLGNPGATYERIEGAVVRFYRHPDFPGEQFHRMCGRTWHDHGWIDGLGAKQDGRVCPGDWVVTFPDGGRRAVPHVVFEGRYRPRSAPAAGGEQPGEWSFQPGEDGSLPLWEAVGQALGGASMCWTNPAGAGVFKSDDAKGIYDKLMGQIYAELMVLADEIAAHPEWAVVWAAAAVQQRATDMAGQVTRPLLLPSDTGYVYYEETPLPRPVNAVVGAAIAEVSGRLRTPEGLEEFRAMLDAAADRIRRGETVDLAAGGQIMARLRQDPVTGDVVEERPLEEQAAALLGGGTLTLPSGAKVRLCGPPARAEEHAGDATQEEQK